MKAGNRSNALLVELLIVVMFFMLSATVLLQVYSTARAQSARAGMLTEALNEAQNVADRLYTAQSPAETNETLKQMGFAFGAAGDARLEKGEYSLLVYSSTEDREAGLMRLHEVEAYQGDERLFTLPVSRYVEARP
ncbi:MAG: hypothetical protein IJ189_09210 [Clostridia bacterium]|nr:hypothetical protein [Clostridia bacterium]